MRRLAIRYGPEARYFPVPESPAHLGSAAENDLVAPFPGVSRRHALIRPSGNGLLLTDLGSTNGLIRDGRRYDEVLLTPGKAVHLGQAVLALEDLSSSDAETALEFPEVRHPGTRPPASETDCTPSSPAAALRLVRELEGLSPGDLEESRAGLLARARSILGAGGLLVLRREAETGLAVTACEGVFPPASLLDSLDGASPGPVAEPLLVMADGAAAIFTELPGGSALAALFKAAPQPWQQDFLVYLADKLLRGTDVRPPRRLPASFPEGEVLRFPSGMVPGSSAAVQKLLEQLRAIVRSELDVLLAGETGTGKELYARLLHDSGARPGGPFVAVNCAAIPGELLEAELFGVVGRVATGVDPRPGLFVQAHGGTLFLDEVGELPERLQAKLLRALQEREVLPLGGSAPRKVAIRVIAASNRDLAKRVEEGTFRADLYYRLRGFELRLPPLRERREDIPALVLAFAGRASEKYRKQIQGISRRALSWLLEHSWPGNVRELEREVERAVLLCPEGGVLQQEHFGTARAKQAGPPAAEPEPLDQDEPESLQERVDALERRAILEALAAAKGNKSEAARRLGITRNGLSLKIERLKIHP